MNHIHFGVRSDAQELVHAGPALCRAGRASRTEFDQQVSGDWENVTCSNCKRILAAKNRQEDAETAAVVDWSGMIYIVTPEVQEAMEAEGWCISDSDRHGWCVERDDEQDKLPDDATAWEAACRWSVPIDHRGRLTKYPVHFRSLEPFKR